jgi:hypothetical protein
MQISLINSRDTTTWPSFLLKIDFHLSSLKGNRRYNNGVFTPLKVLHDYWMTCEVPEVDSTGHQVPTNNRGKLGERFAQTSSVTQSI